MEIEFLYITLEVEKHNCSFGMRINHEVMDVKKRDSDTNVFDFSHRVEIFGKSTYPDKFLDIPFELYLYSSIKQEYILSMRLNDCHKMDGWKNVYEKVKGNMEPVYEIPDHFFGNIEFQPRAKQKKWDGCLFLPQKVIHQIINILQNYKTIYIDLILIPKKNIYFVKSFAIQNSNPCEE